MDILELIRSEQDKTEITIQTDLFDVSIYALLESKYKEILLLQMNFFPYLLKKQWQAIYGKSLTSGHEAIKELVKNKVFEEKSYRGNNYLVPLSRAVSYATGEKNSKPYRKKISNTLLLDHYMRADFFIKTGILLHQNSEAFFSIESVFNKNEDMSKKFLEKLDKKEQVEEKIFSRFRDKNGEWQLEILKGLGDQQFNKFLDYLKGYGKLCHEVEQLEKYTYKSDYPVEIPNYYARKIGNLPQLWNKFEGIKKLGVPTSKTEIINYMIACLFKLPERNCYIENLTINKEEFHVDVAIMHFHTTSQGRYRKLIVDLNSICSCFKDGSFSIRILATNEENQNRAKYEFEQALKMLDNWKKDKNKTEWERINLCKKYTITNTNIDRHFVKNRNEDVVINESEFEEFCEIIANIN